MPNESSSPIVLSAQQPEDPLVRVLIVDFRAEEETRMRAFFELGRQIVGKEPHGDSNMRIFQAAKLVRQGITPAQASKIIFGTSKYADLIRYRDN